MKHILQFTLLAALTLGLMVNTFAQRSCDLQVTLTSPADGLEVQAGDTAWIEFTIQNDGDDPIAADDTLWFWDQNSVFPFLAGSEIPANSSKDFTQNDVGIYLLAPAQIPADAPVEFCIKLVNQSTISYGNGSGPVVTFEDPDTANNWSCVNVTLKADEPSAITASESAGSESLNLYPNPATDQVWFTTGLDNTEHVRVSVTDIMGREVLFQDYGDIQAGGKTPLMLNIAPLLDGLYLIDVSTKTSKASGKLMIRKP